jgi:hypothetical protein
MSGMFRVGCMYCDRTDFDFVAELPIDWEDLHEVQSFAQATEPVGECAPTRSVFDWETHLGVCPECQKTYGNGNSS